MSEETVEGSGATAPAQPVGLASERSAKDQNSVHREHKQQESPDDYRAHALARGVPLSLEGNAVNQVHSEQEQRDVGQDEDGSDPSTGAIDVPTEYGPKVGEKTDDASADDVASYIAPEGWVNEPFEHEPVTSLEVADEQREPASREEDCEQKEADCNGHASPAADVDLGLLDDEPSDQGVRQGQIGNHQDCELPQVGVIEYTEQTGGENQERGQDEPADDAPCHVSPERLFLQPAQKHEATLSASTVIDLYLCRPCSSAGTEEACSDCNQPCEHIGWMETTTVTNERYT